LHIVSYLIFPTQYNQL